MAIDDLNLEHSEDEHHEPRKVQAPQVKMTEEEVALEAALNKEMQTWANLGMNPEGGALNPQKVLAETRTMMHFLKDKLGITEHEIQQQFRKELLDVMQNIRKEVEPQILAKRKAALGLTAPTLIGPDGKPLIN